MWVFCAQKLVLKKMYPEPEPPFLDCNARMHKVRVRSSAAAVGDASVQLVTGGKR